MHKLLWSEAPVCMGTRGLVADVILFLRLFVCHCFKDFRSPAAFCEAALIPAGA